MSVVIAIKEGNHIVIGCDSQATGGLIKYNLSNNCCKIWDIKNCPQGIMGGVGSFRNSQLVQIQDNFIDEYIILKNMINYEYVVREVFNNIYNILKANNRILKDGNNNYDNEIDNSFIFAYKDNAYAIDRDGAVVEIDDFLVIGCGEQTAIGSLTNSKGENAEQRIRKAIQVCSERNIGIDNNVVIKRT